MYIYIFTVAYYNLCIKRGVTVQTPYYNQQMYRKI